MELRCKVFLVGLVIAIMIIEAYFDNHKRKEGKSPHTIYINIVTLLAYAIPVLLLYQNHLLLTALFVYIERGAIFDLVYNRLAGQPISYVSDKWYDRWKSKINPTLLIIGRVVTYYTAATLHIIYG